MPDEAAPRTTNLALGKPATQSSISPWSSGATCETDAGIATNGDIAGGAFFHTAHETAPWWQVDLQDDFVIEEIVLFNRRDQAERLRYFTILTSLSAEPKSWLQVYRKTTHVVFGEGDDTPFVMTPDPLPLARFVRVRLDEPGYLHFRECRVLGYRPETTDHAARREATDAARRRTAAEDERLERDLALGRQGHVTTIDSRRIFVDTVNYSAALVRALGRGTYEAPERAAIKALLKPADRVIDIGTAIGVVAMAIAATVGPANLVTYDANPAMVADARRNFAANRLGGIAARLGVLRNRRRWSASQPEVEFFVSRDFWTSRLGATADTPGIVEVVRVPLLCLEDKIAEHDANVLISDIEGGEADLLRGADLTGIRLIIMETHYWVCGRRAVDDMVRYLVTTGFDVNLDHTANRLVVLDREV